jgi:hypothetical protein
MLHRVEQTAWDQNSNNKNRRKADKNNMERVI